MPIEPRMSKFLCRIVPTPDGPDVGEVQWMSKAVYERALETGTLDDPLLGHPIDPDQPVYLAGEVVFVVQSRGSSPPTRRVVRKDIHQPMEIVLGK